MFFFYTLKESLVFTVKVRPPETRDKDNQIRHDSIHFKANLEG